MKVEKQKENVHSYLVVYNRPFEKIISEVFYAESAMAVIKKLHADYAKEYDPSVIYNIIRIDDL